MPSAMVSGVIGGKVVERGKRLLPGSCCINCRRAKELWKTRQGKTCERRIRRRQLTVCGFANILVTNFRSNPQICGSQAVNGD